MSARAFLKEHGEWVYRAVIFVCMAAMLYLNSRFVTKAEFSKHAARVEERLEQARDARVLQDEHKLRLADHEQRIRELERAVRN